MSRLKLREWKKGVEEEKVTLILVKKDMSIKEVTMIMTLNSIEWRKRMHVADPN